MLVAGEEEEKFARLLWPTMAAAARRFLFVNSLKGGSKSFLKSLEAGQEGVCLSDLLDVTMYFLAFFSLYSNITR